MENTSKPFDINNIEALASIPNLIAIMPDIAPTLVKATLESKEVYNDYEKVALALEPVKDLIIPILMLALKDDRPEVRSNAVGMLRVLKVTQAINDLITLPEDNNEQVRYNVVFTLEELASYQASSSGSKAIYEQIVPYLINVLQKDVASDVRYVAVLALEKIIDTRAIPALIYALENDEFSTARHYAAKALGAIKEVNTIPSLISAALNTDEYFVIDGIAWALGKMKASSIGCLIALLEDNKPEVRAKALQLLTIIKDRKTLPALIPLLEDSSAEVRVQAANALGTLKARQVVPQLINLLQDEDSTVRYFSAWALGNIADKQAVDPLIFLLQDSDSNIRRTVVEALGKIKDPKASPALTLVMKEDDEIEVRRSAKKSLSKLTKYSVT